MRVKLFGRYIFSLSLSTYDVHICIVSAHSVYREFSERWGHHDADPWVAVERVGEVGANRVIVNNDPLKYR